MTTPKRYPGQGKPVPASMGHGAWIVEDIFFLDTDDQPTAPPPLKRQIDFSSVLSPSGKHCHRFVAAQVADALGIAVDDLMEANRLGKVRIADELVPPRPGEEKTVRIRISLDDRWFQFTVGMHQTGSA